MCILRTIVYDLNVSRGLPSKISITQILEIVGVFISGYLTHTPV